METQTLATKVLLLGSVSAVTTAGRHDFPAQKRHQLLAYLACRGEWVSRDRLADLFWSDVVGESARANLRQLLQHLHKLPWLTDLEVERGRIRWLVETDLSAFWAAHEGGDLESALRLYRGPLLQDLEGYEDNEFASWLTAERERAHGAWRDALLRLCRTKPADKAAALYARLLEHDAFDEEVLNLYVAALARA
jgi:DNA-binding SARP family transcriptional activator